MATQSYRNAVATIANGGTETEEIDISMDGGAPKNIMVFTPSALTGTVTIHIAPGLGGTYAPWYKGGANQTLIAAKAQLLENVSGGAMKFVSGSAEGAARVFTLVGTRMYK